MTKICFLINHLENSNGVTKAAIDIVNMLSERDDVEVCLRPLFRFERDMVNKLSPIVKLKPFFGFYFRGFARIVDLIPDKVLYSLIFKDRYDIEIGFCYSLPTKIVASRNNHASLHLAWMHCYDEGLKLKSYYEKYDKVICVSKCNAERLAKDLNNLVPVDFCYNLIDDEKVRDMGSEAINKERGEGILFVSVGRHSPEKGYLRLLECVARLKNDGYVFNLWLIGDGPQHEELVKKTKAIDICNIVYFAGEQSNPHKFTSKADVFVCSSFTEGYSTACTEAVMLGIPVLTTNVSGGNEIIQDAEAGMLVGMEDEDLYQGMKSILEHPDRIYGWDDKLKKTKYIFSLEARKKKLLSILKII
ncbi:MAG: glycosyltransferase [Peptostreptococcaceae bacterium]|nr:glycosyltransferase [Peptostreptococcaceae bacterium]